MKESKGGTANSATMKKINQMAVMRKIVWVGDLTRAEISEQTNLTKSTVSGIVSEFIQNDLVYEVQSEVKKEGRPGQILKFNADCGAVVSLLVDYDFVEYAVVNLEGAILENEKVFMQKGEIKQTLEDILERVLPKYKQKTYGVVGISIGVIGTVDSKMNVVYSPLQELISTSLKAELEKKFGIYVYLDKLGNLLSASQGIHARKNDICKIAINLHSSIDMGAIVNDELYKGFGGTACELGHTILVPFGRQCECGNKGCAEKYLTNGAILVEYEELTGKKLCSIRDFVDLVNSKEKTATALYEKYIQYLAILLNNVLALFSPKHLLLNSYILSNVEGSEDKIRQSMSGKIIDFDIVEVKEYDAFNFTLGTCNIISRHFMYELIGHY